MHKLSRCFSRIYLSLLIFIIGFTNNLVPTFILHFRAQHDVALWQIMVLQSLFFVSYFLVVIPGFYLVKAIGSQRLATYSSLLCATFCLLIALVFHQQERTLLLLCIMGLALALGSLRVVANAEIMQLQANADYHRQVAKTLCNDSLGAILCPPIASFMLAKTSITNAVTISGSVIFFLILSLSFIILCGITSHGIRAGSSQINQNEPLNFSALLHNRTVRSGFWMIFVFIGLEFSIPMFTSLLVSHTSWADYSAGFISTYWSLILLGRMAMLCLNLPIYPTRIIYSCAITGLLLISFSCLSASYAPFWLVCLGLCNANMYPAIFSQHSKALPS